MADSKHNKKDYPEQDIIMHSAKNYAYTWDQLAETLSNTPTKVKVWNQAALAYKTHLNKFMREFALTYPTLQLNYESLI